MLEHGGALAPARGAKRSLGLLAGLVVVWGLLMRQFGGGDVYGVMGPFAAVVVLVVRLVRGTSLRAWFRPELRSVAVGLAVGVAMTALTYPAFTLAVRTVPRLEPVVRSLYADASTRTIESAVAWVLVLVVAEELLWRGALLEALERRMGRAGAFALSISSYALAQLGTGSAIVGLLALVCGAIWTVERRLTGSLLPSVLSHLIWTETVIVLHPVV